VVSHPNSASSRRASRPLLWHRVAVAPLLHAPNAHQPVAKDGQRKSTATAKVQIMLRPHVGRSFSLVHP